MFAIVLKLFRYDRPRPDEAHIAGIGRTCGFPPCIGCEVIDFHCHLDLYPDPVHVADECRRRGLYILSVTTTPSAWSGTYALSRQGDRIRTALGLHSQLAHERHNELPLFDALLSQTNYVGEVGLDGAPDFRAHSDLQLKIFNHVLTACHEAGGRIMSIHSRRAVREVLDSLARHPEAGTPILHCA
jgi:TatD DNase family protein